MQVKITMILRAVSHVFGFMNVSGKKSRNFTLPWVLISEV